MELTRKRPTTAEGGKGTTYGKNVPWNPCASRRSPYCTGDCQGIYSDGVFGYKGTVESEISKKRHELFGEPHRYSVPLCGPCFSWECWNNIAERDREDKRRAVIVNGTHYTIADEKPSNPQWRGFGGNKFRIRFFDGREVTTTNLWHQGEVPEEFAEQLPDNAEFIREPVAEIGRAPKVNDALSTVRRAIGLRDHDGKHCINCGEEYSDKNIYSEAGWREAKISGFCEKCFDENA